MDSRSEVDTIRYVIDGKGKKAFIFYGVVSNSPTSFKYFVKIPVLLSILKYLDFQSSDDLLR